MFASKYCTNTAPILTPFIQEAQEWSSAGTFNFAVENVTTTLCSFYSEETIAP